MSSFLAMITKGILSPPTVRNIGQIIGGDVSVETIEDTIDVTVEDTLEVNVQFEGEIEI